MASELRKTGISVIGDLPWGAHFCYFYETKQDLLDILIPYFKTGLENKEFCLWVISNTELLTMEEATSALRNALPDLDRYVAERSIEIVGHDEWFLDGKGFDPHKVAGRFKEKLSEALARGYEGMRVNGSPAWLRDAGPKELRTFEAELDKLFPHELTIASCTYPLADISADEIFDVLRTHQFAIARRQGEWEVIQSPEPIQARAEIKRLNEELQRVPGRTPEWPAILRYGMAVLSVIAAVILLWQMDTGLQAAAHVSLFLCAIILSVSFGGVRPGLLAIALSIFAFAYFLPPPDSLTVATAHLPRLFLFALVAFFVWSLTAAQRSKAESLGRARDVLDGTVQELKRTNVALQAEIAERKRAEADLTITSAQLRALSARLQSAREEEGTRIAREIHDELGALLTGLKWDLEEIIRMLSTPPGESQLAAMREKLRALIKLTDVSVSTLRRIASELRPSVLDDLGLAAAIEWQAQQFQARTGIACHCECSLENIELSAEQSTAVFRIFQEALTNVLRHAKATRVDIKMNEANGYFVLSISDNGKGMKDGEVSGTESLGLLGMRERAHLIAGEVSITSAEGQGTVVTLRVPIAVR